jgi:hypothetical protein
MRLIHTEKREVHDFLDALSIPRYVALSYSWAADEVGRGDLRDTSLASEKLSLQKLKEFCREAGNLSFEWLWVDTVCVDRSSTAELSEAINSMFKWFRQSGACIVYLSDVDYVGNVQEQEKNIRQSRWMRRSWTLQELIAPKNMYFYAANWMMIGTKESLLPLLSEVTQVDKAVLENADHLSDYSIGRIMSWAANRETRRVEDIAYSLLGLFGVSMPVIYGEGHTAFTRLQEKIFQRTDDATLFAWQSSNSNHMYRGLFAQSPFEFAHFATRSNGTPLRIHGDVYFSHGGVTIESDFRVLAGVERDLVLLLWDETLSDDRPYFGIVFHDCDGRFVRPAPQLILSHPDLPKQAKRIRIQCEVDLRSSIGCAKELARFSADLNAFKTASGANTSRPTGSLDRSILPLSYNNISHETKSTDHGIAWLTTGSNIGNRVFGRGLALGGTFNQGQNNSALSVQKHRTISEGQVTGRPEADCQSNHGHKSPYPFIPDAFEASGNDSPYEDADIFILSPPDVPKLNTEHAFAAIKNDLASFARAEFSTTESQPTQLTGKRAGGTGVLSVSKRRKSTPDSHIAVEYLTDSEDEDAVVINNQQPSTERSFHCPYYVHQPRGHQSCLTRADLGDVRDVKQHLWFAHRRSPFCPICGDFFPTTADCDQHIRARSCTVRTVPDIEGISIEQMKLLARRLNAELSQEEKWFAVWDVVFPEVPRPPQARLSAPLESDVCRLRDYWARQGRQVIAKFLEDRGLTNDYEMEDEERSLEALYIAVLNQMIDEMVAEPREPWGR